MRPEQNQLHRYPNTLVVRKECGVDIVDIESAQGEGYVHGNILKLGDKNIALVMDIFVKPEFRNEGIGQSLLGEYIDYAIEHKATQLTASVVSEDGLHHMLQVLEEKSCIILTPKNLDRDAPYCGPIQILALLPAS